jgi:hypothetical protein
MYNWKVLRTFTVSETYQIVTPESAEMGDCAEQGFTFEKSEMGFEDLAEHIRSNGFVEISGNNWLSTVDPIRDFESGSEEYRQLHITGITEFEMHTVLQLAGLEKSN